MKKQTQLEEMRKDWLVNDAVFCLAQKFGKRKITAKDVKRYLENSCFDDYYCTFTLSIFNDIYHYDGFIELKTPQLTSTLSQALLGATFEPALGTMTESINYCMLEDKPGSCQPVKENGDPVESFAAGVTRRQTWAYEQCAGITDPEHYKRKLAEYLKNDD